MDKKEKFIEALCKINLPIDKHYFNGWTLDALCRFFKNMLVYESMRNNDLNEKLASYFDEPKDNLSLFILDLSDKRIWDTINYLVHGKPNPKIYIAKVTYEIPLVDLEGNDLGDSIPEFDRSAKLALSYEMGDPDIEYTEIHHIGDLPVDMRDCIPHIIGHVGTTGIERERQMIEYLEN